MKKNIILLLLATFFIFPAYSQLKSPDASPKSKIYQEVGLVEIRMIIPDHQKWSGNFWWFGSFK